MDQKAHVAHAQLGDLGDLSVAQIVLELELQHLPLPGGSVFSTEKMWLKSCSFSKHFVTDGSALGHASNRSSSSGLMRFSFLTTSKARLRQTLKSQGAR